MEINEETQSVGFLELEIVVQKRPVLPEDGAKQTE